MLHQHGSVVVLHQHGSVGLMHALAFLYYNAIFYIMLFIQVTWYCVIVVQCFFSMFCAGLCGVKTIQMFTTLYIKKGRLVRLLASATALLKCVLLVLYKMTFLHLVCSENVSNLMLYFSNIVLLK